MDITQLPAVFAANTQLFFILVTAQSEQSAIEVKDFLQVDAELFFHNIIKYQYLKLLEFYYYK